MVGHCATDPSLGWLDRIGPVLLVIIIRDTVIMGAIKKIHIIFACFVITARFFFFLLLVALWPPSQLGRMRLLTSLLTWRGEV
jgi:hypothetical protein